MTRKQRRLYTLLGGLGVLGVAAVLIFSAVGDNLVFFISPSDAKTQTLEPGRALRLGGLVENGSVQYAEDNSRVQFSVTDMAESVTVEYHGILPDLFREGQGVVTEGSFNTKGVFVADKVLAKHDETYMPKEVADALKERGQWKEGEDS